MVDDTMRDVEKFLTSTFMFMIGVFIFPSVNDAINGLSADVTLKPMLSVIPYTFLAILAIFPLFYLIKEFN